jgi:hypothetical protein
VNRDRDRDRDRAPPRAGGGRIGSAGWPGYRAIRAMIASAAWVAASSSIRT